MNKSFSKKIEDFVCENCGQKNKGSGFNNHCHKCLCSKHVDNNPGDRMNLCKGLMKPLKTYYVSGEFEIIHECIKCGLQKKNKAQIKDDKEKLFELIKKQL